MTDRVLLVFDFDGVIVDGMQEYWWSASRACRLLPGAPSEPPASEVPERFRQLRPWVHHGWEMVLQAAEVEVLDPSAWISDYPGQRQKALQRRGWSVPQLQDALDRARADTVARDRSGWLALHKPFPGVVERLRALADEGADWAVLTTKARASPRSFSMISGCTHGACTAGRRERSRRCCCSSSKSGLCGLSWRTVVPLSRPFVPLPDLNSSSVCW